MKHRLYAYLNITNPMVAWEVAIGRIKSSCDISPNSFGTSIWAYSLLRELALQGMNKRFHNEMMLESKRQHLSRGTVSRLSGVYFFESESDAFAAVERWGIPSRAQFISAVDFYPNRLTRVDSEWITSYIQSDETDWMEHYWNGETLGQKPLTEVLASGIGQIRNLELRQRAVKQIYEKWTTSTPLLSMACCGFADALMEEIAMVRPVISYENGVIKGTHYFYIGDLEENQELLLMCLENCKARGEVLPMVVPDDGETFFKIPDFRHLDFELKFKPASDTLAEIHAFASSSQPGQSQLIGSGVIVSPR
ncbi:MAG: hypothetical protein FWD51_02510 [Betaproteobacteria bacterium]|nr:hypothetical protein [Betaproteobacteria bacterium]